MRHATVQREGFTIPLIGIPPDATEERCSVCRRIFPMREVEWDAAGKRVKCRKCRNEHELSSTHSTYS